MRSFIIINGKDSFIVHRESLDDAKQAAIVLSDNSKEIIVREIESLRDLRKILP